MFWLIYVTVNIKMSSWGWKAAMEATAPVVNAIVNNALLHSNLHISQTPPQIIHILRFCLVDSRLRLVAPDFVINCIEIRTFNVQKSEEFIRVSYIIALSDSRQPMMHRMLGYAQLAEKITTSKIHENDNMISQLYRQITSDV